jgi:xylulokinase
MGMDIDDHAALNPYYTAGKLRWIRDNRPDLIDRAYKFLMPKDFIRAKLSDSFVTDIRDCGGTQMLDLWTRSWDLKFVDRVGIPRRLLPDVFPSQSIVGEVTEKSAKETHLKLGTPVIAGSGDGSIQPVVYGLDLKESILVYLGTAPILLAPVKKPVWKRIVSLVSLVFSRSRALPMGWPIWPHYVGGVLSAEGGALLKWFKKEFGSLEQTLSERLGTNPYTLLDQEVSKVPVGSEGLLFLPHMIGERSYFGKMNPYARGVVYGLSLGHTREHLLRAAMEGVAFQLREVLDSLKLEHPEISATSIAVFGGGAKSKIWRQIISDVFGLPVKLLGQEETATLNVTCLMSVALGMHKDVMGALSSWKTDVVSEEFPNPDAQERYDKLYRLYRRLDKTLKDVYSSTSNLKDFYG